MKAFDILTNNFGDMSNFDRLFHKFINTYEPTYHEYIGTVPTTITSDGTPLLSWIIYGNKDNGVYCGERTENLYDKGVVGYNYDRDYKKYNANAAVYLEAGTYTISTDGNLPNIQAFNENLTRYTNISNAISSYPTNAYYKIWDDSCLGPIGSVHHKAVITLAVDCVLTLTVVTNLGTYMMVTSGSTAPSSYIPYGYKIPIVCGGVTTLVYIGDEPLRMSNDETTFDEVNNTGVVIHRVDSDGNVLETPTTTSIEVPEIPTTDGTQTFDVDTTVSPSSVYICYY